MKTLDLFSKGEQTNRYLVLCDAPERQGDVASKANVETWARKAAQEELDKAKELNKDAIEKALKAANAALLTACSGEASVPAASCLVIVETTQKGKSYPEYLVGGVGDCRVYGIGKDKAHVVFSVPEKKDGRLGASDKLEIHFMRISGKTYPTLLALPQKAYAHIDEKHWSDLVGAPNLPEKARALFVKYGEEKSEGWIVTPSPIQREAVKKKRPLAALGLVVIVFLAVAGTGLWIRERKDITQSAPIANQELSMSTILADAQDVADVLEAKELEVAELHDQLTEILEDNDQLIASLKGEEILLQSAAIGTDPSSLDLEVSEIGSRFEKELSAQQSLLAEYQEEISTLREGLQSYEDLASLLEEKEMALQQFASMEVEQQETLDQLRASQKDLSDKLAELTEAHGQAVADRTSANAEVELLQTHLTDKEGQITSLERINQELSSRLEEVLATERSFEEKNQHLALQIEELKQFRDAYEREHQLRLERDETLAALAVNIEGWRRAVESMERSREMLAQELAELRAAPRRRTPQQMSSVKRIHLVSPGETLESIAHRYYSDFNKVDDLLEANHDVLKNSRQLEVGTALVVP